LLSHERGSRKDLEEDLYSGWKPKKEPDQKHGEDELKEPAPMPSNQLDKVSEKNSELDKEDGLLKGREKLVLSTELLGTRPKKIRN